MSMNVRGSLSGNLVHVATRQNVIVNRLNKTKIVKEVDHEQERVDRIKAESAVRRAAAVAQVSVHGSYTVSLVDLTSHDFRERRSLSSRDSERPKRPRDHMICWMRPAKITTRIARSRRTSLFGIWKTTSCSLRATCTMPMSEFLLIAYPFGSMSIEGRLPTAQNDSCKDAQPRLLKDVALSGHTSGAQRVPS